MKLLSLPIFATLLTAASLASAATNVTYTASGDPNGSPDSNNQTVDVWTLSHSGDATAVFPNNYGSYYSGPSGMLSSAWGIYANPDYTTTLPATSEADQTTTFAGGALTLGQTVSIDFLANSVNTGQQYGLRLDTGSTFVLALSFIGGDGGYRYYDAGSSGNIPFGYQQNGFNFAFTQKTAKTYTAVATPIGGGAVIGTFSGTDSGSPDTLQIYNESAGDNNNVLTNNLSIVPEPSTYAFAVMGGLMLVGFGVRSRMTA